MKNTVISKLKDLAGPEIVSNINLKADQTKRLFNEISHKTTAEIEKVTQDLVGKFVTTGQNSSNSPSEEVKHEIAAKFLDVDPTPKGILNQLRYVNEVVATIAPKSISDVKNLRTTISEKLISDAKKRIEDKNVASKPSHKTKKSIDRS